MQLAKIFIVTLLFGIGAISGISAQTCVETLNSARESFNKGHLYDIPALLKECLDKGFNKDQRIEAYFLLTRTYLFIDDPISAEDSYLKLLKQDPEFRVDSEIDPVDLVYLSEKFKTTPIFVIFAKAGANITTTSIIHNYGVDNTLSSNEEYSNGLGFQFGGGGELNISDRFSFGLEVNFRTRKYNYSNSLFNADGQSFVERQTGLDLPIFVKYRWDFVKIRPFVYAGFGFNYLLSANATVRLIDKVSTGTDDLSEKPVTGPEVDVKDQRTDFNHFAHLGIGANYRIGYNYLVVDVRYMAGFSNIVDADQQYGNETLLYKYGYVDDDKRLNNISISIGYVHPLYKPRKINRATAKGIFSRILRK